MRIAIKNVNHDMTKVLDKDRNIRAPGKLGDSGFRTQVRS